MISLDSNIIVSYLNPTDANHASALRALKQHGASGYVISPATYAELCAWSWWPTVQGWLQASGTRVVWDMPPEVWALAGERQGEYTIKRRTGTGPRRILPDFLIAAHAEFHGLDVMSFDRTVYDSVFTKVNLIDPLKT